MRNSITGQSIMKTILVTGGAGFIGSVAGNVGWASAQQKARPPGRARAGAARIRHYAQRVAPVASGCRRHRRRRVAC